MSVECLLTSVCVYVGVCYYNTPCSLSPEEGRRQVLQLKLSEVVVVGAVEGSSLTIHFSSSLDVMQAARSVYGHSKNKVGHGLFISILTGNNINKKSYLAICINKRLFLPGLCGKDRHICSEDYSKNYNGREQLPGKQWSA